MAAALLVVIAVVGGTVLRDDRDLSSVGVSAGPSTSAPPPLLPREPLVGDEAPDVALDRVGGAVVRPSDLRGRPLVIDYFASWCVPCRAQLDDIASAQRRWSADVTVLVVVFQDETGDVQAAVEAAGVDAVIAEDRSGAFTLAYGVPKIPTFDVVRPDGRFAGRFIQTGPPLEDAVAGAGG